MAELMTEISLLTEDLSEKPDKWFENPCGWLTRPSYKRAAQKRSNEGKKASWTNLMKESFSSTAFKRRWFVLDRATRTLKFFRDEISTELNGWIDLKLIRSLRYSIIPDAPTFALDLVSQDINYTIAASSKLELLRWAVAVQSCLQHESVDSYTVKPKSTTNQSLVVANNTNETLLGADNMEEEDSNTNNNSNDTSKGEWLRFDYTLKRPGPLRINVMGTVDRDEQDNVLSHWLIVSGFASGPNGEQSEAKMSGQVRPKDYVVGVNGEDITNLEFQDAMAVLKNASMPRTLHFLRDLREQPTIYFASWAWVYYESLNKRRKRYLELSSYALSFRKPLLTGGINAVRDAYFLIDQIALIKPFVDKATSEAEQKYLLRMNCKKNSIVNFVGSDDMPVGGSIVSSIELCFASREEMDKITSILQNASERMDPLLHIVMEDIRAEPIETIFSKEEDEDSTNRIFGLKSFITSTFALRVFELKDGYLTWKKLKDNSTVSSSKDSVRSMFIANEDNCGLKNVSAIVDRLEKNEQFRYQLILVGTDDQTITMGMADEVLLMQWLDAIRELVDQSPEHLHELWEVPDCVAEADRTLVVKDRSAGASVLLGEEEDAAEGEDDFDDDNEYDNSTAQDTKTKRRKSMLSRTLSIFGGIAENNNDSTDLASLKDVKEALAGYLYYRHNTKTLWKKQYSRYYFVLKGMLLLFYKSAHDARISYDSTALLGKIDLNSVLEVKETRDPSLPDNFLEIVTQERVYAIGAENETVASQWLEVISDLLESRSAVLVTAQSSNVSSAAATTSSAAAPAYGSSGFNKRPIKEKRSKSIISFGMNINSDKQQQRLEKERSVQAKLDSVRFQGGLGIKCRGANGHPAWKDKYFVITDDSFIAFSSCDTVFKEKKVDIEISLAAIQLIETSDDKICMLNCGIDIHTYVRESPDIKVFTFQAQTSNLARLWMEHLCNISGKFELRPKQSLPGAYESHRISELQELCAKSLTPISSERSMLLGDSSDGDSMTPNATPRKHTPSALNLSDSNNNYNNSSSTPVGGAVGVGDISPATPLAASPRAGAIYAKKGLLDVRRSQSVRGSVSTGYYSFTPPTAAAEIEDDGKYNESTPPPAPTGMAVPASLMDDLAAEGADKSPASILPPVPDTLQSPMNNAGRGGRGRGRGDLSFRRLSSSEETLKAMRRASEAAQGSPGSDEAGDLDQRGPSAAVESSPAVIPSLSKASILSEEDDESELVPTPTAAANTTPRTSVTAAVGGRGVLSGRSGRGRGFRS